MNRPAEIPTMQESSAATHRNHLSLSESELDSLQRPSEVPEEEGNRVVKEYKEEWNPTLEESVRDFQKMREYLRPTLDKFRQRPATDTPHKAA